MFFRAFFLVGIGIFQISSYQCLKIKEKIIGGKSTNISEIPYQIALLYDGNFICGGSIINAYWILTAAHCVYEMNPTLYDIRAGSSTYDKNGIVVKGIKVIYNKNYNSQTCENDIALIKLQNSLEPYFGPTMQMVELPKTNAAIPNSNRISGWGKTSENSDYPSPTLNSVLVTSYSKKSCEQHYGKEFHRTVMFCAGRKQGGIDSCQGDSGGPLVSNNTIFGVVSFGVGCGRAKKPGVYSRVPYFRKWIDNTIANNN